MVVLGMRENLLDDLREACTPDVPVSMLVVFRLGAVDDPGDHDVDGAM